MGVTAAASEALQIGFLSQCPLQSGGKGKHSTLGPCEAILSPMASAEIGNRPDTQDSVPAGLIEADYFGEPCEPVTRVAIAAVFRNPLT